ncbi:MAG: DUF2474 family protein [Sphingomonas sp.]|nr:DUF2474 family protein [Sphingomonas sp.]
MASDAPRWGRRLTWLVAIWGMSVGALAAVACILRWWLRA